MIGLVIDVFCSGCTRVLYVILSIVILLRFSVAHGFSDEYTRYVAYVMQRELCNPCPVGTVLVVNKTCHSGFDHPLRSVYHTVFFLVMALSFSLTAAT